MISGRYCKSAATIRQETLRQKLIKGDQRSFYIRTAHSGHKVHVSEKPSLHLNDWGLVGCQEGTECHSPHIYPKFRHWLMCYVHKWLIWQIDVGNANVWMLNKFPAVIAPAIQTWNRTLWYAGGQIPWFSNLRRRHHQHSSISTAQCAVRRYIAMC